MLIKRVGEDFQDTGECFLGKWGEEKQEKKL